MCRVLTALFLIAAAGCWTPGDIVEGLPKHTEKFVPGTSFYLESTEPRVRYALLKALERRGFPVREKRDDADIVLSAKVGRWEFNDAGFSGFRDRDDMDLVVVLRDRKTKFIRARATVTVRSDFRILSKYVDSL